MATLSFVFFILSFLFFMLPAIANLLFQYFYRYKGQNRITLRMHFTSYLPIYLVLGVLALVAGILCLVL